MYIRTGTHILVCTMYKQALTYTLKLKSENDLTCLFEAGHEHDPKCTLF
jgi:hypothetical protein